MALQITRSSKHLKALFTVALRLSLFCLILPLSLPGRGQGESGFTYQLALSGRKLRSRPITIPTRISKSSGGITRVI